MCSKPYLCARRTLTEQEDRLYMRVKIQGQWIICRKIYAEGLGRCEWIFQNGHEADERIFMGEDVAVPKNSRLIHYKKNIP